MAGVRKRRWNENDMKLAIAEVWAKEDSCRAVARKYGMTEGVLRSRFTRAKKQLSALSQDTKNMTPWAGIGEIKIYKNRRWTEDDMQEAIAEVQEMKGSCYAVARKYKIAESVLRQRIKKLEKEMLWSSGENQELSQKIRQKAVRKWKEVDMQKAIAELLNKKGSCCSVARKYKMAESTLRGRFSRIKARKLLHGQKLASNRHQMPDHKNEQWKERDIEEAIAELKKKKKGCRSVAEKYKIPESVLRSRMKKKQAGKPAILRRGRKPALSPEIEIRLAEYIHDVCNAGFCPSKNDIFRLAQDYIHHHNLSTSFNNGKPGKTWLQLFINRNGLSMEKIKSISSARESKTLNPSIVYNFFDTIEKVVKNLNLQPNQIWSCAEISFSSENSCKDTNEASYENTTVLAACNAEGAALPPLVIFPCKKMQTVWKASRPIPGTLYDVSESGWVTSDNFYKWFLKFTERIQERPLLFILDNHETHVNTPVIELAM